MPDNLSSDPTTMTLAELSALLKGRKLSARELAESYLERIKRYDELNAFLKVSEQQVLEQADSFDAAPSQHTSKLAGIPLAVKDSILTKGLETTAASKMLQGFIPPYDATVIKRLREAGMIVLGKTNMDEFCMGSSTENSAFKVSKNPWDRSRVPGGTSGGSAVSVAARLAPIALGSDTGGSVRQPASFCGVVGFKPSYGRLSRYGLIAYASSLDQIGVLANNVADASLVVQSCAGFDSYDATSLNQIMPDLSRELGQSIKGLRIGVSKEYFAKGIQPDVERSVRAAIDHLVKLGARIVEIELAHTEAALSVYYIIACAEASSNLARFDGVRYGHRTDKVGDIFDLYANSRAEGFGPEVKRRIIMGTYVLSSGYYDAFYQRAQKVRTLVCQDFKKAFTDKCDVICCPVAPTTAFKIGENVDDPLAMYLQDIYSVPVNLAGLPGISIPCGFDSAGLPVGLQILAAPYNEAMMVRVASAYESSTEWHKKRVA